MNKNFKKKFKKIKKLGKLTSGRVIIGMRACKAPRARAFTKAEMRMEYVALSGITSSAFIRVIIPVAASIYFTI